MKYIKTRTEKLVYVLGTLLILAFVDFSLVNAEEFKLVRIQTIDYPPLMGKQKGFLNDVTTESFKRVGIKAIFQVIPLSRINWSVVNNGSLVYLGAGGWITQKEARNRLHFTIIAYSTFHFYYLKSRFPKGLVYNDLSDLKQYTIGSVRGSMFEKLLTSAGLRLDSTVDLEQNVKKLVSGRIDFYFAPLPIGSSAMWKVYPNQMDNLGFIEKPIREVYGHAMFQKGQEGLKKRFEEGFKAMREDGTYLKIYGKYWDIRHASKQALEFIRHGFSSNE